MISLLKKIDDILIFQMTEEYANMLFVLAFAAFSHNANMLTSFFFIYITRIKNIIERIRK